MTDKLSSLQLPPYINATAQLEELKAAIRAFLSNVKIRLGEHSSQVYHINKTLHTFEKGKLSKREAHKTIVDTLEGFADLKREFMDIFMQPATEWHPDDFDIPMQQPLVSFVGSMPQFLQPAHEPQMRLPALSSNWFTVPQAERSASHVAFKGYDNPTISFPTPPDFAPSHPSQPPALTWTDHSASTPNTALGGEASLSPPIHMTFRDPWQTPSFNDMWSNSGGTFSLDSLYSQEHFEAEASPRASYDHQHKLQVVHPQDSDLNHGSTSYQQMLHQQTRPRSLGLSPTDGYPIGEHEFDRSSMPEEHSNVVQSLRTPLSQSPPGAQHTQDVQGPEHDSSSNQFVHSLCGKGFSTLSAVKKHHWGKKINDLTTKTGCWAKHRRPDAAWNDHPSCQMDRPAYKTTMSVTATPEQMRSKTSSLASEVSSAVHVPHLNTVPGFPTLHDLPRTVAQALNETTTSISGMEQRESLENIHRTPSRTSFENLLTAASVVPQIDAPKPQAQAGSIALRLDAQVAATEQMSPSESYASSTDPVEWQRVPLGASPVPKGVRPVSGKRALETTDERTWYRESESSSGKSSFEFAGSSSAPEISRTLNLLPVQFSGPVEKKRKL